MRSILAAIGAILFALSGALARAEAPARCARVVSLAPSITETLFDLGLGPRVVGVTRYCRYPDAARQLPKVGGFLDPSMEAIVGLRPDVVVTLAEQGDVREMLRRSGLEVLEVEHRSVRGILDSMLLIGARCGAQARAREEVERLRRRMDAVRGRVAGLPRPRVMVSIGGDTEDGLLRSIFIAGTDGYYNELIDLAGGVNAVHSGTVSVPGLSAEGVLSVDPDIIIQVMSSAEERSFDAEKIGAAWRSVPGLRAVRERRVFVLLESYAAMPGPRFIELLERFTAIIHPDLR